MNDFAAVGRCRHGINRTLDEQHVHDVQAAVGFAMLVVGVPIPILAKQIELAVAADNKAAGGAQEENLLVGLEVFPVAGEAKAGGIVLETGGRVRIQAGLQQIGIVALDIERLAVGALRGGVLVAGGAVEERGVDLGVRRQVVGHARIQCAAGQGHDQAGDETVLALVARGTGRTNALAANRALHFARGVDEAVSGHLEFIRLAVNTEGGGVLHTAGNDPIIGGGRVADQRDIDLIRVAIGCP